MATYSKIIMRRMAWFLFVAFIVFLSSSCATLYHRAIMRGSIIETSDSEIFLCIGKKDGASVGQELNVYKIVTYSFPPKASPTLTRFKREYTGMVKIIEIIDEHFAKAIVISGTADKNSIVELHDP